MLAWVVHECAPGSFSGWEWVGWYCTCGWCGEVGYRWATGWILGEHLEERDGARTKNTIQMDAMREELSETQRDLRHRQRETRKLGETQHQLTETKKDLRKARQYVDRMTDFFGPMPETSNRGRKR